jgi:fumarate hydratase subunit alpha
MADIHERINSLREVHEVTRQLVIEASTAYRADQLAGYRAALAVAPNATSRWVLQQLLKNAEVAQAERRPLCDDTGIPHLFLELGTGSALSGAHFAAMVDGVRDGLRSLPGRAMGVFGEAQQRVEQSAGLSDDPSDVVPPALVVKPVEGAKARLTVMMLGGGPEIRSHTYRVFHKRSLRTVLDEVVEWAVEGMALLGCTPGVLALGVGRTHYEATALMLEGMAHGDLRVQDESEQYVTDTVNDRGCGPLGLGGQPTVLGTFISIGPQRASGVRIVCLRPGCCMDPRRASAVFA